MRVFVAGATGAIGSRLVPLLVSAGHSAVGLTRTPAKADAICRAGGEAAVADALNRAEIVKVVAAARPDDWVPALAAMLGAKPPRRIPGWLARVVAGGHVVVLMAEARGGSNAKAKRDLAWQPKYASWRQGVAAVLSQRRSLK